MRSELLVLGRPIEKALVAPSPSAAATADLTSIFIRLISPDVGKNRTFSALSRGEVLKQNSEDIPVCLRVRSRAVSRTRVATFPRRNVDWRAFFRKAVSPT